MILESWVLSDLVSWVLLAWVTGRDVDGERSRAFNMDKQDEVKPVKMHQVKRAIISCLVLLAIAIYTLAAEAIRRRMKKGQVDTVNIRLTSQLHPDLSKRHSM